MILGLFETHIEVADLDRVRRFSGETLGLEFGLLDEERRVAFYRVGPRGDRTTMEPPEWNHRRQEVP